MNYSSLIQSELEQAQSVLNDFISNPENFALIEKAANLIVDSLAKGGKVISCGNGGSHCDAMHFAEELTGRFRENRNPLPAISISDPSYITCTGNDYGFDHIFSRFVEGVGHKEDVLFALSTSGNSKNVINAVKMASEKGMKTVILTGNDGGSLAGKADLEIRVPHHGYADRIQEIHIKLIHIIILLVEKLTQKK